MRDAFGVSKRLPSVMRRGMLAAERETFTSPNTPTKSLAAAMRRRQESGENAAIGLNEVRRNASIARHPIQTKRRLADVNDRNRVIDRELRFADMWRKEGKKAKQDYNRTVRAAEWFNSPTNPTPAMKRGIEPKKYNHRGLWLMETQAKTGILRNRDISPSEALRIVEKYWQDTDAKVLRAMDAPKRLLKKIKLIKKPAVAIAKRKGKTCQYCGKPVESERYKAGYHHCKDNSCVNAWRRQRLEENYSLHLVPKQGYAIVPKKTMVSGRSSGR